MCQRQRRALKDFGFSAARARIAQVLHLLSMETDDCMRQSLPVQDAPVSQARGLITTLSPRSYAYLVGSTSLPVEKPRIFIIRSFLPRRDPLSHQLKN
jgi:hypothetical protein